MKLHTDFRDYYDTAVGFGVDANVHYNRFTTEVEVKLEAKSDIPPFHWNPVPAVLGFCGQIYPLLEIRKFDENYKVIDRQFVYTYQELLDSKLDWKKFTHNEKQKRSQIKQFFINWQKQDDQLFREHKVPVWIIAFTTYDQKIILNPRLGTLDFSRIKNAITAFQEISMYLSNILVEQKEIAVIADKHRIEQHGFDLKTSFRKDKKR